MRKSILLTFMTLLYIGVFGQTTWTSDPNHSRVGFTIEHLGINEITGSFDDFTARIISDGIDLRNAQITLEISVGSVNTGIAPRDKHLRSADFFAVESYPSMKFESTAITKTGTDKYDVKGRLSLHGITKDISVSMKFRGVIEDPKNPDSKTMGVQITGSLKRSDFQIGPDFPAPMIGDVVYIKADGEFKNK